MYNRILVPTDGSELSDKALEAAADFAKALGSSIVIITVIEPYSYTNLSEYRPESIDQYEKRHQLRSCGFQILLSGRSDY